MSSLYVTEAGAYIRRNGGHVVIGRNNEILFEVPFERIEDITVFDTVHISSSLVTEFIEKGIPITWLSGYGKYFGTLINTNTIDIYKHKKQFDLLDNHEFRLALSRKIIRAKVRNQLTLLRRYARNLEDDTLIDTQMANIKSIRRHIGESTRISELMGYEGIISRIYFEALGKMVPLIFSFQKRTKQPPRDPFNAALGLGYSMLFNEILAGIVNAGLHPFVGCMHALGKGHPALASDLIEEWRAPIIDAMVMHMVHRNMISPDDFDNSDKGCFMTTEGRKVFLAAYNKKIRSENQYMESRKTYRECIYSQCKSYASAIIHEDIDRYTPLEIH
ncbi:CRISPR-associated endonuclease Cas1 [Veillonella caviae]|uniref:CRISPR-associated endonuclease Cas1 n=1 Tax=Veillonella caviae TaxID=248316 RepID=UPI0023A8B8D7|nr:CRISPR-associated endonuclease Cas1 [Veillonella caviae]MCI5709472.1 CRISPR-associated endonuclease Cas1 [Veillonella caviae]MDY5714344.1 CRISPR-associated endonuclease Cas1 [Veillonella caviae]MDY5787668.1 CRISPR-associated endonuclease Cas1 [Veillonella caviae]